MPIATRTAFQSNSWAVPRIDLGGCVLYLPLWRPSSDMTGTTIYSYDTSRYACTVTGTVWEYRGRVFDGDDYIKNSTANWRSTDSAGTIIAWTYFGNTGNYDVIFSTSDEASTTRDIYLSKKDTNFLRCSQRNNDTADDEVGDTTNIGDSAWHMGAIVSTGTAYLMYVDGVPETFAQDSGADTGDWFADTSARDNFTIGVWERTSLVLYATGTIGEIAVYNRVLAADEIMRFYQATKWRYA